MEPIVTQAICAAAWSAPSNQRGHPERHTPRITKRYVLVDIITRPEPRLCRVFPRPETEDMTRVLAGRGCRSPDSLRHGDYGGGETTRWNGVV